MARLDGKVIVVKGGGQGFGRAYCLGLAVEGATVAIAEMAEESALETQVAVLELRGHAVVYHTDVRDETSVLAMRDAVERDVGGIDGLINNTGILSRIPMAETTKEVWDGVFDTNVWGGARAVVPSMSRRRGGSIVEMGEVPCFCAQRPTIPCTWPPKGR